jgi:aminoglycoside 6'-N-acetyltransferase I
MSLLIKNLSEADIDPAAQILVSAFAEHWPDAWPDLDSAREEVSGMLEGDRICRGAWADSGTLLGWIGGILSYEPSTWELHPLAVHPDYQGQKVGTALVHDFEAQVMKRGGLTIMLGSDDEDGMTSLAHVDLYDKLWDRIRRIENIKGHPYSFYQKLGYSITGVIPDANGPGKPDILMCKRLA